MLPTVLIVEDDRRIAALVSKNLEAAGFRPVEVHRGDLAEAAVAQHAPSLVILDLSLPGADGLEVLRRLRAHSEVPVLLLTARSTETDKVLGFEIGADDYLTKPFGTRELVARARALLRRTRSAGEDRVLERDGLRVDFARRTVERDGRAVEVTTLEFDLLAFLAGRPGRVFTREALLDQVWGEGRVVDDRSIDSLVSRLRRKIEPDPSSPRYLQTVWGAGYRFADGAGSDA
ncbi:MAG: response regulator transcription factor [Acidobacteriota bacterium]